MSRFPEQLKYTKEHEWASASGNIITIGITDHAQSSLGDIVYLDLPKVGRELKAGETFGVVESVKAVSDLYAPVSGKVTEVNTALAGDPAKINSDAHGQWMIRMEVSDSASAMNSLMSAADYSALVASL